MTILQALKSKCKYPVDSNLLELILLQRGLNGFDEITRDIANSKDFQLAGADLLINLIDATSVQEGGMQINATDKSNFIKVANTIYAKYGEPIYGEDKKPATIEYMEDWC